MKNNINCIILCAGTGSRMNCDTKNKVCFEIKGKPAVVRVIENLQACGVTKFVVVVGNKAESVMGVLSGIPGVTFAFQKEQLGTGNAAMCGLNVLNDLEVDGPVMTVMGDKLIDKSVFETLINDFYAKDSDVSLITQPSEFNKSGGKIVLSDGKIAGIVEHMDLLLLKVNELLEKGMETEEIYSLLALNEKQKAKIDVKIKNLSSAERKTCVEINGKNFYHDDILASGLVNCATYLYKRDALNNSLRNLKSDNAQNEIYFTDTVMNIAKNGVVSYVTVSERKLIHTFNTVEELDAINNYFKEEEINE